MRHSLGWNFFLIRAKLCHKVLYEIARDAPRLALRADGKVEFEGVAYESCSAAADSARSTVTGQKMNTNGWTFWQFTDKDGENKTLFDARQRFLEMKKG